MSRNNTQSKKVEKRIKIHGDACVDSCEKEEVAAAKYYRAAIHKIGKLWDKSIPQGENFEPLLSDREILEQIAQLLDEVDKTEKY